MVKTQQMTKTFNRYTCCGIKFILLLIKHKRSIYPLKAEFTNDTSMIGPHQRNLLLGQKQLCRKSKVIAPTKIIIWQRLNYLLLPQIKFNIQLWYKIMNNLSTMFGSYQIKNFYNGFLLWFKFFTKHKLFYFLMKT